MRLCSLIWAPVSSGVGVLLLYRSPALAESHIPPEMSSPGREETPLSVPDQRREGMALYRHAGEWASGSHSLAHDKGCSLASAYMGVFMYVSISSEVLQVR